MCSPCDCGDKEVVHPRIAPSELKQCRRCGSEPFVFIDKVRIECKQCFLEFCNRKFRTTVGKSKLVKNDDSILLAYSGGPNSAALLDLVYNSMQCDTGRKQKFKISILHIDTSLVADPRIVFDHEGSYSDNLRQRTDNLIQRLESLCRIYPGWAIYFTTIQQYFKDNVVNLGDHELDSEKDKCTDCPTYLKYRPNMDRNPIIRLCDGVDHMLHAFSITDMTNRQHFVNDSCFRLIDRVAGDIVERGADNFKYVMTGSGATRLSNDMLVGVILGKGSEIGPAVSICDRRTRIPVMRPLREFSNKEIAFYLKARDIVKDISVTPNLMTFAGRKDCIQSLTEAFLSKLSLDYPSTYSTLIRTGSKMKDSVEPSCSSYVLPKR